MDPVSSDDEVMRGRSFLVYLVGLGLIKGDSFPPHDTTFEVPTSYQKRGDLYAPYACLGWLDLAEAL